MATGLLRGLQEVGRLTDLFGSSYGRVLAAKAAAVAAMIPLSVLTWKRRAGAVRLEAALAVLVVGAAALLAAYPLPPSRAAEEADRGRTAGAPNPALPGPSDLTLGDRAGQILVGLTLRPAVPGRNEVLVYLLPVGGEASADDVSPELSVNGRPLPLRDCGPTCRRTETALRGGEQVQVRVAGPGGGAARFALPDLPAPDGTALLQHAQDRIHAVGSYRLDETLDTGLTVLRTRYAFAAPDRMRAEIEGRSTSVWIGETRYVLDDTGATWTVRRGGPPPEVPSFTWDFFGPLVAPRIVGSDEVDGVLTQVVAFFAGDGDVPVWFRLWVAADGLVPRAEMRAQGHFMSHRYVGFDDPLAIDPPVG